MTRTQEHDDAVLRAALPGANGPAVGATQWRAVLLAVLVVSAAYVHWYIGRGWMPFDDGALAHSAERLLQGQLPHRDFDEIYTGGLTVLNAVAFRLLGTTLLSPRLVLFAVFLAWVPAVFYVALRFVRPFAAGGVTLLAVVWSLPNYPAAMPSWYNLFFATFGVAAVFRFLENGCMAWLATAGFAAGLSCLMKVVGLYDVAGVMLFLVFHAHALSRAAAGANARRGNGYAICISIALLLFVAALCALVRSRWHAAEVVQFVVPGTLLAALLVRNEWFRPAGDSRRRFMTFARLLLPFLSGVVLPIALFLVPYAFTGALGAFVNGVFVLPMRRYSLAYVPALPLAATLALVPFAIVAVLAHFFSGGIRRREMAIIALAFALFLLTTGEFAALYRVVWYAVRSLLPVLVLGGVLLLAREREAETASPLLRARTMVLLTVTALASLVQFPYSVPNYFCYVAPLIVLTALALYRYVRPVGAMPGLLLAFLGAFAVLRVNGSPLDSMGFHYEPHVPLAALTLERGGLEIPRLHATVFDSLVPMLRARAHGGYTWASPDAPEIYFLARLRNPTRTLFEIFEDSTNRDERVLRALDEHGVTAIVLNTLPAFSPPVSRRMRAQLTMRYPNAQDIGPFQLRWRQQVSLHAPE